MAGLFSLEGKRALVTGANTGIGQAIAVALAGQGASVTCVGRRACDETVALIEAAGGSAESLLLDFADPMAARDVFTDAGYSLLVNNAGIIRRADSTDYSEDDWDAVVDTNMKALFFTCQAFGRELIAKGEEGAVVNIASLLSFQGGIRVPAYTASKHGVAGITKILANEWAPHGITVNAIAPGYIATNNTAALRADPERSEAILARIPAGRWGDPEDIGGTAAYLCSRAARYVTGAVLNVDGGWLAR
ncbi:2-dehydro-3-deoxy-D-gluconate 5-dehydrogenase KduD [Salipiger sp. PrR002]|uniref:2-dehydro-3-deoxy-D-gluconate 5-dehydrogenase KduD n=1 Tax=Salipiger sp. PrR002 TaxID=2706489 RepID=UPI0013BDF1C1|nr:2-dehydro-3-deoxy-D-gluconate 5-dehydrogenase KduD [Salipiger sp. PrR002]NDW02149.1 2-dehydro-3-deoxy-D-gluconate 5-dehydrogenase KduD [Salipiger sp. PrR002]NDW59154.1 2-dehydro-3-deoxy-D-gluconate 5-dehydrogenase KduD [Salipiger sp. PrR004]